MPIRNVSGGSGYVGTFGPLQMQLLNQRIYSQSVCLYNYALKKSNSRPMSHFKIMIATTRPEEKARQHPDFHVDVPDLTAVNLP
jgi:hypothetical protein